jgi:hypothetical protein
MSFKIAASPHQRIRSRVLVQWDSRPYFTLTEPVRVKVTLRLAVYRQSVRFCAKPLETHGQNFFSIEHLLS